MTAAFTPGPWKADRDNDVLAPDGTGVAAVHGEDADNEEANARLISAAPDLLEMLKKLVERRVPAGTDTTGLEMVKMRRALIDEAAAVIAKAEGR